MKTTIAALVIAMFQFATNAADTPVLRSGKTPVQIVRISPSSADLQKARVKAPNDPEQVHVVKVHVEMPPPGAELYALYIGDQRIEEYGSFDEGIFFKSYQRKDLDNWRGKPVRFIHDGETIELGTTFPLKADVAPARLPDLNEVLRAK